MVYVDRLSGCPFINMWDKDPNTSQVIQVLKEYFSMFGKPLKFRSDGGSQFDSMEMRKFLEEKNIQHGQSSPYNPRSNGHAERNVKILKELLLKTNSEIHSEQFLDGISQIRNTPRADGISPCQVVFGRSIRTILPTLTEALGTNEFLEASRMKKIEIDGKQKSRFDEHAKRLVILQPDSWVWIQNDDTRKWDQQGVVVENVRPRTYKIRLENGKIIFRNRRKIRPSKLDRRGESIQIDPDEPTYCLCDQVSYGKMIGCDNDLCPMEWVHFNCVQLSTKPKGKWYCPKCRGDKPTLMKPKAQFLKELEKYNKEREEKLMKQNG